MCCTSIGGEQNSATNDSISLSHLYCREKKQVKSFIEETNLQKCEQVDRSLAHILCVGSFSIKAWLMEEQKEAIPELDTWHGRNGDHFEEQQGEASRGMYKESH